MILCLWEFYKLFESDKIIPHKIFAIILSSLFFIYIFLSAQKILSVKLIFIFPALLFLIFIFEIFKKSNPFQNISYTLLGIFYIAIPFSLLNFLVFPSLTNNTFTFKLIFGLFFLIWAYDVWAFFIGSWLGKHLFFKRISPKKTWEGTIGGFVITLLTSIGIFYILNIFKIYDWLILATIISFGAIFGDLIESMFKRSSNIKDSGKIMPGHGGILDRFDSSLIAIPFIIVYLIIRFSLI